MMNLSILPCNRFLLEQSSHHRLDHTSNDRCCASQHQGMTSIMSSPHRIVPIRNGSSARNQSPRDVESIVAQPRRCSREMEKAELEAEASLKEYAMLQRILQHRQSGRCGGQDSLESSLIQSPLLSSSSHLFQPTTATAATAMTTTTTPSSVSTSSLHQILCGINQSTQHSQQSLTQHDPAEEDGGGGEYPNNDDDSDDDDDGVFDFDM
jgi:hypothetical protein